MNKVIFFSYFLFLFLFVLFSYLFVDPGLFYLKSLFTNYFQLHRTMTVVLFSVNISLFFIFYTFFLKEIKQNKFSKQNILTLIIGSVIILLFAYPAMLSFDIFNYIATAKVTFFYHENPYILMPIEFTHDPLLLFMHAANKTALYAPFWILLTGIPYLLGFGNFLAILFNFKLLAAVLYAATVFLLWKITKSEWKTALFALNPLVLIELLVSSHNESVMLFLLLISIYFLYEKGGRWGIVAFLLSGLIKYVTFILSPLYVLQGFKPVSKQTFFLWTIILMYIIFFLSAFREEIYPWYALWFLLPMSAIAENNLITWVSITFSFSMLLRYIPFMLLGTYFGPTPILKIIFMLLPVIISIGVYVVSQKERKFI